MLSLINWRLKVTINDGRAFVGQMLAFDRHMNLVLAECEEFRRIRPKKKPGESEAGPVQEMKRTLGLVILRGETVVSLSVEGPPPVVDEEDAHLVPHVDGHLDRGRRGVAGDVAQGLTHDGQELGESKLSGCNVECPRHGATFDVRTGKVTAPPAVKPIGSYAVREVDGQIEVQYEPPKKPVRKASPRPSPFPRSNR